MTEDMDKDHLAAAPKQQLPEPAGLVFFEGGTYEQGWVSSQDAYTADQLHAAIAAEREHQQNNADNMRQQIADLRAENFKLAAGQCVNATADDGGTPYCAELSTLRQQLAEAVRDAKRYRWLRRIDSFAEWNRAGHCAADALDAAIDAAIAAQGEAKPPAVERELFEGE